MNNLKRQKVTHKDRNFSDVGISEVGRNQYATPKPVKAKDPIEEKPKVVSPAIIQ